MAVSTSSYFNNSIVGVPQVGADVDIYEQHALPKFALGTKFERADGNVYRYSHFGDAVAAGLLVSTDVSESSVVDTDNAIIAPSATYQMSDEQRGVYPGAIGSRYVVMTLAATTADQFAGAYFVTTDDTGEGYTFRILTNTATNDPATGLIRIKLDKPLLVALDATTDFAIQGSLYANLETFTIATDTCAAGVTLKALTTSYPYAWIQTKGVCGILSNGAIAIGSMVVGSAAGNVVVQTVFTAPVVGYSLIEGDNTGQGVFKINLE